MKPLLLSLLSTLSVILGLAGLSLLALGLRRMGQASRSRTWPTVPGTVVSSSVVAHQVPSPSSGDETEEEAAARPLQTLYRPEVKYTYRVNGQDFTGTALGLEQVELSHEDRVRAHAARYVPGSPVTVYYDPEAPQRALLEPGVHAASWLLPAMGLLFLIVTGAFYLFVRWYSGR